MSNELSSFLSDGDRSLHILFGSQSGNSEDLAVKFGKQAKSYGLESTVHDMDGFDFASLSASATEASTVASSRRTSRHDSQLYLQIWASRPHRQTAQTELDLVKHVHVYPPRSLHTCRTRAILLG